MNQMEIRRNQILTIIYIPGILALMWILSLLGDHGSGYFLLMLQCCLLPVFVFFLFLPHVMEKLIRSRMSKRQFKNADKVWKSGLFYALICGVFSTVLLWICSGFFADKILGIPYGEMGLRVLIPIVFLVSIIYALKGYFQGMGSGMPTLISEVVFLLFSNVFGYVFLTGFKNYGSKVAALLQNSEFEAMYSSTGFSLGVLVGGIFTVIFLVMLFLISGRGRRNSMREGMKMTEDMPDTFRLILLSMVPYFSVGICLFLPGLLDAFFYRIMLPLGVSYVESYSVLFTDYILWLLLFSMPVLAGVVGLAGKYINLIKKEEYKHARDCMHASLLWIFMTGGLFSVTACTLGQEKFRFAGLLIFLLVTAFFLGLILWKIGRTKEILISFICASLGHILTSFISLKMTEGNVDSILYAYIAQMVLMILFLGGSLFKTYRIGVDFARTILFPALSVAIAGVVILLLGKILLPKFGNVTGVLLCVLAGWLLYLLLIIILRCLRVRDLYVIPGGKTIIFLGKTLHFWR